MGQTMSEPETEKHTTTGSDDAHIYGSSEMQGWRIRMEDAHATILQLSPSMAENTAQTPSVAFFAVYDGHGGETVAQYAGKHLHNRIASDPEFIKKDYAAAIKSGFLGLDADLKADPNYTNCISGSTAVCAIINEDGMLIVGNSGDSRAVLSCNGSAVPLSFDHKPCNPEEFKRIRAAGGFVELGRVNGKLALSRALGDFSFKMNPDLPPEEQIVTANPVIMTRQLNDDDEFLVLACDGIWDCMTSQKVVDFVRLGIARYKGDLGFICEALMEECLATDPNTDTGGIGYDNMTVIIVGFLRGRSIETWIENINKKVEENRVDESDVMAEMREVQASNEADYHLVLQTAESSNDSGS